MTADTAVNAVAGATSSIPVASALFMIAMFGGLVFLGVISICMYRNPSRDAGPTDGSARRYDYEDEGRLALMGDGYGYESGLDPMMSQLVSRYTLMELLGTLLLQLVFQGAVLATGTINNHFALCGGVTVGRTMCVALAQGTALTAILFATYPYSIYSGSTRSAVSKPRALFGCGHFNRR